MARSQLYKTLVLRNVQLSNPHLLKPGVINEEYDDSEVYFTFVVLDKEQAKEFNASFRGLVAEFWGEEEVEFIGRRGGVAHVLKSGDSIYKRKGEKFEFLKGKFNFLASTSLDYPPSVVGTKRDENNKLIPWTKPFISGTTANIGLSLKAYTHGRQEGIVCYIQSVQILQPVSLSSVARKSAEELFDFQEEVEIEEIENVQEDKPTRKTKEEIKKEQDEITEALGGEIEEVEDVEELAGL